MRLLKLNLFILSLFTIIILFTSASVDKKEKQNDLKDLQDNNFIKEIQIKEKEQTSFLTNLANGYNNTVYSMRAREGLFSILTPKGKLFPLALFPEFSFKTPSPITIEAGLGGGYRDYVSRDLDKKIRDDYTYWFVGASFGVTYRDVVPNFSIGVSHVSRIQKVDTITQGDPLSEKEQFPFYIGYFDILLSYSKMNKYLYSKKGIATSFLISFYINGFFTLKLSFDWASDPFVEIKNSNDDVMFAINYTNHERILQFYNFKGHSKIPDVIKRDYLLGLRGVAGQTDRPLSLISENTLMMQGPRLFGFRPFFKLFFDIGLTYGAHCLDHNNVKTEYLISPGFDLGINLLDFISVAFRASFPLPYYLSGNDKSFYHLEGKVSL